MERRLVSAAVLLRRPSTDGETIEALQAGDAFQMLDDSLGWSWGYAGADRRVGYVPSVTLVKD